MSDKNFIPGKTVFQSKFFRVLEIEVERQGKKFTKDLIEKHPSVYILPLNEKNEIYMEWQYRDAFKKEILEIVSGTIENGADPLDGAKRELKEETGLIANNWKLLAACEGGVNTRSKIYIFLATDLVKGEAQLDDDEILRVITMPFEEAVQKAMKGEIVAVPHIAGILLLDQMMKEGKL